MGQIGPTEASRDGVGCGDRNGFKPRKVIMMEQCNPGVGVCGVGVSV